MRFSLTTLLLVVNVAGLVLFANTRIYEEPDFARKARGWPVVFYVDEFVELEGGLYLEERHLRRQAGPWQFHGLIVDIGVGIFVLLVAGLSAEFVMTRIRKRGELVGSKKSNDEFAMLRYPTRAQQLPADGEDNIDAPPSP